MRPARRIRELLLVALPAWDTHATPAIARGVHLLRRVALLLVAVLFLAFVQLAPVFAHGTLVRSDPPDPCGPLVSPRPAPRDPRCATGTVLQSPPATVSLWFSEPVSPFAGGIRVTSPSGRRVEQGRARADGARMSVDVDATEPGTYLVRWQIIASDTHPARGAFAFSVGEPSVPPDALPPSDDAIASISDTGLALQVLGRWLHFAGYALGFGPLAFAFLVLRPLRLSPSLAFSHPLPRLVLAGIALLVIAEACTLLAQTVSLAPDQPFHPDALASVLASSSGRLLAQRTGAAILLWALLGGIQHGSPTALKLALLAGAAFALIDAQASHAPSVSPPLLGYALTALHIAAMGLWLGGLATLLVMWRLPALHNHRVIMLRRFGRVAAITLALLLLSGLGLAWQHLGTPANLSATSYGRSLTAKLLLLLVVVFLAWESLRPGHSDPARWWRLEATALLGIVALAGLLVSLPPP